MRLDDLAQGMRVSGIVPGASVTVIAVERYGDGGPVLVTFRDPEGKTSERYLHPADDPSLELETTGGAPPFDGDGAERRARELEQRLEARLAELEAERDLRARRPVIRGMALIIPRGLLERALDPEAQPQPDTFARDRDLVERLAVNAVLEAERAAGREPREMPHANPGYDVESRDPATGTLLFIEVKGRSAGARTVTLTRTEILTGLNRPDTWFLALVEVEDGRAAEPRYVQRITDREPGFAETSVNFDLGRLLAHAVPPTELHTGGAP